MILRAGVSILYIRHNALGTVFFGGVLVMEDDLALILRAIRVNKPSFCHHHHSWAKALIHKSLIGYKRVVQWNIVL